MKSCFFSSPNGAPRRPSAPRAGGFNRTRLGRGVAIGLIALQGIAAPLTAKVSCPAIFSDHMVLQRGQPVAIWGEADPQEAVTVEFAGQKQTTTATADGRWQVKLAPMAASAEPRTLSVQGQNTLSFSDVLVGEVWFCSGQSNMEKPLGLRHGQKPTDNYEEAIQQADHPQLRLFRMPWYGKPMKNVKTSLCWVRCTPETIVDTQFSAAAYYFGRQLHRDLGVPVGLVESAFGGTQIEAWIPKVGFEQEPALRGMENVRYPTWVDGVQATELYQSMIVPLQPYTVRGFLWYQGESNVMENDGAIYTTKMRALIDTWRTAWGAPAAPFYFVQIAPFDYSKWDKFPRLETPEALPVFWEAQTQALAIPHTGMIVITDLVKDLHDIHPTNKLDVGLRLERLALADTYGRQDVLAQSPHYERMQPMANGQVEVTLADVGTGLASRDGQPLTWFTIAGADRHFYPAKAVIAGKDKVIVSSPEVKQPVAVRFGWDEVATPNLVNSAGLPANPFRTDTWPVVTERPKPVEPKPTQG